MLGGTKTPCVPKNHLKRYREKLGQDCPRVALEPGNRTAWELLQFARAGELATGLTVAYSLALMGERGGSAVLSRVRSVLLRELEEERKEGR